MKNINNVSTPKELEGRLLKTVEYVEKSDIQGKRILNIGCGYGWFELYFHDKGAYEMIGCEITDEDLSTARANVSASNIKYIKAGALDLPFVDNYFDTVVSWEVIEHIPRNTEEKMFSEVSRVLKRGGNFYLSTPHDSILANISDPAWLPLGHRHYTTDYFRDICKKNNFEILDLSVVGGFWVMIDILNLYFSKWILRRDNLFKDFFKKKTDEEFHKDGYMNIFLKAKNVKS